MQHTSEKERKKKKGRISFFSFIPHKQNQSRQIYFVCRISVRIGCLKLLIVRGNQQNIINLQAGTIPKSKKSVINTAIYSNDKLANMHAFTHTHRDAPNHLETSRHHYRSFPPASVVNVIFTYEANLYSLLQPLVKITHIIHVLFRITNHFTYYGDRELCKAALPIHTNKARCKSSQTYLLKN